MSGGTNTKSEPKSKERFRKAFGAERFAVYAGLSKTHLQEVATATGINILRTLNHLNQVPTAKTRISRFATLAH
jgi:hypothetical protein